MNLSCLVITGHSDLPETHLLIGLFKAGIDMEVLCPADAPHRQLLLDANVPVDALNFTGRFDRKSIQVIRKRLQQKQVDIIHTFNNKTLSNTLFASRAWRGKIIAYRGIEGNVSYFDPMSWLTYLHPRVNVIVCVADAIRRYFWNMRFLGIKLPVKKALTIYKGHDPNWYQDSIALSTFGIPDDAFVVGCTVNDRPRKGLSYLIAATTLLPADLPIHFVFIGKVNDKELLAKIASSPYADRIHLLGFQQKAAAIIRNCDVCVLPAIKREGLPKAIIEGMIQGVAPIVTNSGGSPELIEDGRSGIVIAPKSAEQIAQAIEELYRQPDKLAAMKQAAKLRISEDFSVGVTVQKHLDFYKGHL